MWAGRVPAEFIRSSLDPTVTGDMAPMKAKQRLKGS